MKGKNILVTAACVIGFGGIIGNTLVGVATSRELRKQIADNKAADAKAIQDVKNDAKEADEAYKASTVAELKAYVNSTRDSINAANEAARANLEASINAMQNKINALKAELESEIEGENDALRTQIVNQINTLVEQVQNALNVLGDDVDAVRAAANEVAETVVELEGEIETLQGDVATLKTGLTQVANYLSQVMTAVNTLTTKMSAAEENLAALEARLDGNYYTAEQINEYLGQMTSALNGIVAYLTVDGAVMTMENVNERVAALEELSETLDTDMESFNGEEATNAKAAYIEELFAIINAYDHDVVDTYNSIVEGYDHQGLVVPSAITDLKDSLLASSGLSDLKDQMMIAMTRIILAPTKEDAKNVRDQYAGDVEYEIDQLRFELDRIDASNEVYDIVDEGAGANYEFTNELFDLFNEGIMVYEFDNTNDEIEDRAAYYAAAKADLAFKVQQAEGLKALLGKLNVRYANIEAMVGGTRLTDDIMIAYYLDLVDQLAVTNNYIDAITATDEDGALILDSAEKIADYVDVIDADASVIEYAADQYNVLLVQQDESATLIGGLDNTILPDADKDVILEAIATAVAEDAYQDALDAARNDNELDTAARKAAIDALIAKKVADCKYQQAVAQYLFDITQYANEANAEIDALENLTAAQISVIEEAMDEANVPTLDELYELTGYGTEDQYATEEQWTALFNENTADMAAAVTLAKNQDAMKADEIAKKATLAADSAEADLPADVVANKAEFDAFVEAALSHYTIVTDDGFVNPDELSIIELANASATALEALKADTKAATDAYEEYIELVKSADNLNKHIDARMAGFEDNFAAARDIYNPIDAAAVLADSADTIESLKNDYKTSHGIADASLPEYEFDAEASYADAVAALAAFRAEVAESSVDVTAQTNAFDAAAAQLEIDMANEFDALEAQRLADNKAHYTEQLAADYAKVIAAIDAIGTNKSTQKSIALALYNAAIDSIDGTTLSNQPEAIYKATYANFATKVFDLLNSNQYDTEDPRYAAEEDVNFKTASQQLEELLAAY